MIPIGMFSKLGKTTIKTLRHYDEVGLLSPAHIDESNNYRYYTTDQLFCLHKIIALRQMGFSISEISGMANDQSEMETLERRKAEIESECKIITDQLFRLNHYITEKKEGYIMNFQAVIKELPEYIVFSKRQIIPNYDALFTIFPEVGETIMKANPTLKPAQSEYCFSIYHDGEFKETDIDVEVGAAVGEFGKEADGISFKKMPVVTVASVMHKGAYADLDAAYAFLFRWIEKNDYAITDSPRESYIDGIWNKEKESDWLTEIQIPVEKK